MSSSFSSSSASSSNSEFNVSNGLVGPGLAQDEDHVQGQDQNQINPQHSQRNSMEETRTIDEGVHRSGGREPRIVIVGGGISGIGAAHHLITRGGFRNVTILEATDRIGGRIHSLTTESGQVLEMGAQWLHGEEGNDLLEVAREKGLIGDPSEDFSVEGSGHFLMDTGHEVPTATVDRVLTFLATVKEGMTNGLYQSDSVSELKSDEKSVGECFRSEFLRFLLQQGQQRNRGGGELMSESRPHNGGPSPLVGLMSASQDRFRAVKDPIVRLTTPSAPSNQAERETHTDGDSDTTMVPLSANHVNDDERHHDSDDESLEWSLFDWFSRFERIDNACQELEAVSPRAYTDWTDCEGVALINFPPTATTTHQEGYQALIRVLLEECVEALKYLWRDGNEAASGLQRPQLVQLNSPVESIEWDRDQDDDSEDEVASSHPVRLLVSENGRQARVVPADHVIFTCSLGVLQHCLNESFFRPPLPTDKTALIRSMGYGLINKIYIEYDTPFWCEEDLGFQFLWTRDEDHRKRFEVSGLPEWVRDISGFDVIRGKPHHLLGWIGGEGALAMELESDQTIAQVCGRLFRLFLADRQSAVAADPCRAVATRWQSNSFTRGAYSFPSLASDRLMRSLSRSPDEATNLLMEPLRPQRRRRTDDSSSWPPPPVVLFAGEATDREYYSTTHGAFRAGCREAERVIELYRPLDSIQNERNREKLI